MSEKNKDKPFLEEEWEWQICHGGQIRYIEWGWVSHPDPITETPATIHKRKMTLSVTVSILRPLSLSSCLFSCPCFEGWRQAKRGGAIRTIHHEYTVRYMRYSPRFGVKLMEGQVDRGYLIHVDRVINQFLALFALSFRLLPWTYKWMEWNGKRTMERCLINPILSVVQLER